MNKNIPIDYQYSGGFVGVVERINDHGNKIESDVGELNVKILAAALSALGRDMLLGGSYNGYIELRYDIYARDRSGYDFVEIWLKEMFFLVNPQSGDLVRRKDWDTEGNPSHNPEFHLKAAVRDFSEKATEENHRIIRRWELAIEYKEGRKIIPSEIFESVAKKSEEFARVSHEVYKKLVAHEK